MLPVCVACLGFTGTQFAAFRQIVDANSILKCEISNMELGQSAPDERYEILVVNCFDTEDRSGFRREQRNVELEAPSAVNLAIVPPLKDVRNEIYLSGFSDYLIFPFVENEVIYRLHAAAALRQRSLPGHMHSSDAIVERACKYMERRLDQPISISELTSVIGTNRNTLTNRFRKELGVAPIGWHRERRLRKAADLISSTNEQISKISGNVGFSDSNNFSTAFRKTHGVTPREYRKMK
jgi:AraC-like DNA-binding protein